ncbi:MAG: hypothetical protein IKG26_09040 [Bacillus sp. (in: Bacteria)]|nr:hypothetical protein [Bacillus sp. (in: firmicutes)]
MDKECKYCSNIKDVANIKLAVDIFDKNDPKMYVVAGDPYEGNDVRINYCPLCGNKLREELLEDLEVMY